MTSARIILAVLWLITVIVASHFALAQQWQIATFVMATFAALMGFVVASSYR
jgi:hypothetical protein